jgi:Protein of unknown function (DUF2726)
MSRYRSRRRKRSSDYQEDTPFEALVGVILIGLRKFVAICFEDFCAFTAWLARKIMSRTVAHKSSGVANISLAQSTRNLQPSVPYLKADVQKSMVAPDPSRITANIAKPFQGERVTSVTPLPYRRTSSLLSQGERAFWLPLLSAVQNRYLVFCKVRLGDIVHYPDRFGERRWFKKISAYHLDFVLCDPITTAPLMVIELDDRSHSSRRSRDEFKDQVLQGAGIPIYRVRAQQAYDPIELKETIQKLMTERR